MLFFKASVLIRPVVANADTFFAYQRSYFRMHTLWHLVLKQLLALIRIMFPYLSPNIPLEDSINLGICISSLSSMLAKIYIILSSLLSHFIISSLCLPPLYITTDYKYVYPSRFFGFNRLAHFFSYNPITSQAINTTVFRLFSHFLSLNINILSCK